MQTAFLILAAKTRDDIQPWQRAVAQSAAPPGLHFTPTRHHLWADDAERITVAFWQGGLGAPPGADCERWSVTERGIVASTGHLRWRGEPWVPEAEWARRLGESLQRNSIQSLVQQLHGVFTVLTIDRHGTGAVASDPLGFSFIFHAEKSGSVVVASRSALCAHAATEPPARPGRDALAACWPAYSRHWIGLRTGYDGVRLLPQGTSIRFGGEHGVAEEHDSDPWLPGPETQERSQSELLSLVYEDLADTVRTTLTLPEDTYRCDLTGGKDTRLIAAIVMNEALGDRFTFQTFGPPMLPDVQIASELASQFRLPHEVRFERRGSPAPFAERAEWFVHATAGMVNLWNIKTPTERWPEVRVTGVSGYVLRSKGRVGPNATSEAHLVRALDGMGFGGSQLLLPDTRRALRDAAITQLFEASQSDSLMDRFDAFDLGASQRHLLGLLDELEMDIRIKPLSSATAVKVAWALGGDTRFRELIHVMLIRRWSDEFARYPFAGSKWRRPPSDLTLAARAVPPDSKPLSKDAQLISVLQGSAFDEHTPFFREVFDDVGNPVWQLLDRQEALKLLDGFDTVPNWQRAELFGAATAAMWLGGV